MPFTHGTNYGYLKKKCRCTECRAWWNNWFRNYVAERCRATGEAFSGRRGGFVPGKPCACGCGLTLPAASPVLFKRGHRHQASAEDHQEGKEVSTCACDAVPEE